MIADDDTKSNKERIRERMERMTRDELVAFCERIVAFAFEEDDPATEPEQKP
jgi:hypothetical protein